MFAWIFIKTFCRLCFDYTRAPRSVRVFMNPCECIGSLSLHTLILNISVFLASFFISYFCINKSSSIAIRWPKIVHGKYPKSVNALRVEAHALAHAHLWRGTHTQSHMICMLCCLVCTEKAFLSSLRIRNVAALRAKQIKQTFCLYPE